MKNCSTALLLASLFFAQPVYAGFQGPHSSVQTTNVMAIEDAQNHSPCRLEGHLLERVGEEDYLFQDATGTVTVTIRAKHFSGHTVTPDTKIQLYGIIDKALIGKTRIRVRELTIMDRSNLSLPR